MSLLLTSRSFFAALEQYSAVNTADVFSTPSLSQPYVYVSVEIDDHLTINFGPAEKFTFRTHHDPAEVASMICAQVSACEE